MNEQEAVVYSVYVGIDWAIQNMMFAFSKQTQMLGSSMLFSTELKQLIPGSKGCIGVTAAPSLWQ